MKIKLPLSGNFLS